MMLLLQKRSTSGDGGQRHNLRNSPGVFATTPLDFIQAPGFPSAIRVFAGAPAVCCSTLAVAYFFDRSSSQLIRPVGLPVHVAASQLVPFSLGTKSML